MVHKNRRKRVHDITSDLSLDIYTFFNKYKDKPIRVNHDFIFIMRKLKKSFSPRLDFEIIGKGKSSLYVPENVDAMIRFLMYISDYKKHIQDIDIQTVQVLPDEFESETTQLKSKPITPTRFEKLVSEAEENVLLQF